MEWNTGNNLMGKEQETLITQLRENNYPIPQDCQKEKCQSYRPACQLGICKLAVVLCGDF